MISEIEVVIRLVLAAIIGGAIGYEREINNRPAGLRTHVLVTMGAALMMLVSKYAFSDLGIPYNPSRIASQVVSGIGFLGAGTIIMQGNVVHGLTTAASLWTAACIGLAIGAGYYLGGITGAIIVIFTLIILRAFENSILKRRFKTLNVFAEERMGLLIDINETFDSHNVSVSDIKIGHKKFADKNYVHVTFDVKIAQTTDLTEIIADIIKHNDVVDAYWESNLKI